MSTVDSDVQAFAEELDFPEGPVCLPDGSVVVLEVFGSRVTRVRAGGRKQIVAEVRGGPNGAAIGPDGALYVCNNGGAITPEIRNGVRVAGHYDPGRYIGGRIQRVDLTTGAVDDLYTECDGRALGSPNDLVFDASGGFYFTDHGRHGEDWIERGAVYYATADGHTITPMPAPVSDPNGIALSPDQRTLYYTETASGRLFAMDLSGDAPGPPQFLATLTTFSMFDSIATEAGGNICVGTLGAASGITVFDPEGSIVERFSTGDVATTNISFGGPEHRRAYITLSRSGVLLRAKWPRPGLALNCEGNVR